MAENMPPHLNLSVTDHLRLLDAIFQDEGFQEKLVEDPVGTLTEYIVEFSEDQLAGLTDEQITIPSKEALQGLVDKLRAEDQFRDLAFGVVHIMCGRSE